MLGKTDKNPQLNLGEIPLMHYINTEHELCRLAGKADWGSVEKSFSAYYSTKGAPSIPVRTVVGLSLLRNRYRCSEKSALVQWTENPYWQHFCGEVYFRHEPPFNSSEFGKFRHRIGREGEERIARLGAEIFGREFLTGNARQGRKHGQVAPKNSFSRMIYALGNYLQRVSS